MAARKTPTPRKPAAKRTAARKPAATKPAAKKAPAAAKSSRRKTPARARKGPAVKALERELKGPLEPMAGSALAASALALARQLDKPRISATATASCSRALLETLERLRALVPPREENDAVDDLRARHQARRGGAGT